MLSVVVPTKNRPESLNRTLYTLSLQTGDIEIIVCDDGSTRLNQVKNKKHCEKYRAKFLINSGKPGVASTRNYAALHCSGDYIAFCDDDDFWLPEKSANQLAEMKSAGRKWVYSTVVVANQCLEPLGVNSGKKVEGKEIYSGNPVPGGCSSVMVEKQLFDSVGGFDNSLSTFADWDLWIRLFKSSSPAVASQADVVYIKHDGQMSDNYRLVQKELELVFEKHGVCRDSYKQSLLNIDRWVAWRCVMARKLWIGIRHVLSRKNYYDIKVNKLILKMFVRRFYMAVQMQSRYTTNPVAVVATDRLKKCLVEIS